MNLENLKIVRDFLTTYPSDKFDMQYFHNKGKYCVFGLLPIIFENLTFERFSRIEKDITYNDYADKCVDKYLEPTSEKESYLIGHFNWAESHNTIEHTIERIDYLLNGNSADDFVFPFKY